MQWNSSAYNLGHFFALLISIVLHRPERWANIPDTVTGIPGIWGNMLTFLGGPRACIGYRFSLVECVILLPCLLILFMILMPLG